ncbi:MAG: hypothetical protein QW231_02210 [Candidatus Bathyarchaeia archaeon]
MVDSVSRVVQDLISRDLSLQDALQRGYANYSAVARMLQSKVEGILGRRVKLEGLITSVKRAKTAYQLPGEEITWVVAGSTLNLRTDVAKVSVEKTNRTLEVIRRTLGKFLGEFLHVLVGISAVTLIFDQRRFEDVCSMFPAEEVLDKKQDLAALVVQSPREIIDTAGCITTFYNQVSRKHINIEETVSCFTDTIIVLSMEDVDKAFTALTDLISEARKAASERKG